VFFVLVLTLSLLIAMPDLEKELVLGLQGKYILLHFRVGHGFQKFHQETGIRRSISGP